MEQKKGNPYITPLLVAITLAVIYAIAKKIYVFDTVKTFVGELSNCFLLPGVLLGGAGAIGWIGTFGTYDMLSYGTRSFFGIFIKPLAADLPRTFYEYRVAKDEKGRKWSKETLIVGLISLAVSMILLLVYYLI